MKNKKSAFKLNKQKVASLEKKITNAIKGQGRNAASFTNTGDPTANTRCFDCPPHTF